MRPVVLDTSVVLPAVPSTRGYRRRFLIVLALGVDAMRVPHVVGRDVALAALSRYTRQAGANPLRLTALARQLGGNAGSGRRSR
jgi:hypothetical protein